MSYVVIIRAASSTVTPRIARSLVCSSYASPLASALAKIVGFDVTPRTWKSLTRASRLPLRSRSLLMSSSQTDTPAWVSSSSTSVMCPRSFRLQLLFRRPALVTRCLQLGGRCSAPGPGDGRLRGGRHGLGGDAVLLVEHGLGGGRAVVVHADRLAGVADENLPWGSDAR